MTPKISARLRLFLALSGLTAVFGALALTATVEGGRPTRPAPPKSNSRPPVRYTVAPGVNSQIVMKTLPGGVCTLYQAGKSGPAHGILLHAQPDGTLHFRVRPAAESKTVAKFIVECKAGGKVEHYPLELRFSSKPTAAMPSPAKGLVQAQLKGALTRRALSAQEITSLSDKELWKRGYPPRPNAREAPKAFAVWRRAVSSPTTVIKPQTVSVARTGPRASTRRPSRTASARPAKTLSPLTAVAKTSPSWSGFELRGAANGTYDRVEATWKVPFVTGPDLPIPSRTPQLVAYSSFWIGLDGDFEDLPPNTLGSLWQAGTEQKATTLNLGTTTMVTTDYYAWSQLWPDESEHKIVNFPVEDGDEIYAGVWIGDNLGQPTPSPTHYGFWMQNVTRKQTTLATFVLGSKKIVGREAVWILESPGFNDKFGLANYFTATMSSAHARRASSPAGQGFVPYGNDPNAELRQLRMTSDGTTTGTTLSTVAPVDTSTMRFQWGAFR